MIRDSNVLPQLPVDCSHVVASTLNEIDVSLPMGVSTKIFLPGFAFAIFHLRCQAILYTRLSTIMSSTLMGKL